MVFSKRMITRHGATSQIKFSPTNPALTYTATFFYTHVKSLLPVCASCSSASECGSDRWDHRHRSPGCHYLLHASSCHSLLLEEQEQIWRGGDSQWNQVCLKLSFQNGTWVSTTVTKIVSTFFRSELHFSTSLYQTVMLCLIINLGFSYSINHLDDKTFLRHRSDGACLIIASHTTPCSAFTITTLLNPHSFLFTLLTVLKYINVYTHGLSVLFM